MKILLLNQFFWPDLAATSVLATDLARYMSEQGHEVSVICGNSIYLDENLRNVSLAPAVDIRRIYNFKFARGATARILSYTSFWVTALWQAIRVQKPDVVVTLTTPPLLSFVGTILKRLRGCRHFIWEMDMYPDVAIDLNVISPHSWLTRAIGVVADFQRHDADGIIALGECMKERLVGHGISAEKIHVAENWADGKIFYPRGTNASGPLEIVYPGNLGMGHDISTIAQAMQRAKDDVRLRFVFVGGGPNYSELREFCLGKGISNVSFDPYRTQEKLAAENLAKADIGLVTQNFKCVGSIVPSKVYPIMAAGLPILFVGRRDATPSRIIERHNCGWQVNCGDTDHLVALLDKLASDRPVVVAAGRRAREAFLEHYDLPHGVSRICDILQVPQSVLTMSAIRVAKA